MKKGFTLVELLAVIVILAIILAIAVPTISSMIDNSRFNTYKNQQALMKKSAMIYLSSNTNLYPTDEGEDIYIPLSDLMNNGNISTIIDPKDKSVCNASTSGVKVINLGNNQYGYETYLNCSNYQGDSTAPGVTTSVSGNQLTVRSYDEKSITFNGNGQYTQTDGVVSSTVARTYVFDIDVIGYFGVGRIFSPNSIHNPDLAIYNTFFSFYSFPNGTNWKNTTSVLVNTGRKKITYIEKNTGEITVYEGSTQVYSGTFTAASLYAYTSFKLGNRYDVNNERMVGRMFEFQLWNKALTPTEVANNITSNLTGLETDLAIYYKFDETYGNTVMDYSTNKDNATIVGASFTPDGSGVKQIRIKQGITVLQSSNESSYTFILSSGTYTIEVEDNVGNITTKTVTI